MSDDELRDFLESRYKLYNQRSFIETDPISIPHLFTKKEDIEIAALFAATLAWGQRSTIIKNATRLVQWMDMSPHDFVVNFSEADLKPFKKFVHRTFNGSDCIFFLRSLKNIYSEYSLEKCFAGENALEAIAHFRKKFFSIKHPQRTLKHVSDPRAGSAAKRLNMFLRWMIRKDEFGVDFGLWEIPLYLKGNAKKSAAAGGFQLSPAQLMMPLDVHSGNVARKLGLLKRKQNDWRAVEELTEKLKNFDPLDPVKYDLALFGTGVFEKW
jgi:uncharacterized protein (TIGR02757 family)